MHITTDEIQVYKEDNKLITVDVPGMKAAIEQHKQGNTTPYTAILNILTQYSWETFRLDNTIWFPRDLDYNAAYYKLKDLKYPTWPCFPSSFSDCSTIIRTYIAALHDHDYYNTKDIGADLWQPLLKQQ